MSVPPATNDRPSALGIIAGAGRFPYLVAEGARRQGLRVVIIALRGLAAAELREVADQYYTCGLVRLGRWIRLFRREGVTQAIMAGSVRKSAMYGRFRILRYLPDWSSIRVWYFRAADKRNDTILRAAADFMAERGITLTDCVRYTPEQMAPAGVLTEVLPSASVERDAAFGWAIAKEIGRLDIGQAIAVKEQEVIAVEAIEGTDRLIRRAGELCRSKGWTLIKVAKPDQDMRFDVPTIGPDTIRNLADHGCQALVIEAGKTVIVDLEQTVSLASSLGICIIGR